MNMPLYKKSTAISLILGLIISSTGLISLATPRTAQAQGVGDVISFVAEGRQTLDGCQGITGSKYEAIAAELGMDLQGGVQGGLTALGDELAGPGQDVGNAVLGGLQSAGEAFTGTGVGDAISSIGTGIAETVSDSGIGQTLANIGGSALSAAMPVVGNVLGGVVGGLFGGGGPEEVVEKGLRKLEEQGQKIMLFEQQKMTQKERCLDALAQESAQKELRKLTNQSVEWLQGEFNRFGEEGNPGFVEDLELFLNETSDDQFRSFVSEVTSSEAGSFSSTCNFLRRPILESVTSNYINNSGRSGIDDLVSEDQTPGSGGGCSLTDGDMTEDEAQAFLSGDFSAGGWEGLARSVSDSGSSPIGAYLQQEQELDSRINAAEEQQQEQLRWGQGFIADRHEGGFTPGSVVQGITERLATSDVSRLELIDEMGEVAGDIGSSLIGQITRSSGSSIDSSESGLSTAEGGATIGGDQSDAYEYLASSLADEIATQLEIEEDVQETLLDIVPLYEDDRIDDLVTDARSCLSAGNLDDTNADVLLSDVTNNLDTFRNTVLLNKMKVDWRGEPLNWRPVIKEEQQKKVGWNGSDYDWEDDEVERYYKQGAPEGCEGPEDIGNTSYIVTEHVIHENHENSEFNGVFRDLEPTYEGTHEEIYPDPKQGDIQQVAEGGQYDVWEKQVCNLKNYLAASVEWKSDSTEWEDIDWDGLETATEQEIERRREAAKCDLNDGYYVCIAPAWRSPQIISGNIYKENTDDEIEASSCAARSDAGDHYFVNSGDETWSVRECQERKSPQGSAVEWESGFPESADETDIPVYVDATSTNPVDDQYQLVDELDELLAELESEDRDVLNIQERFYALEGRFNSESASDALEDGARDFVRNVRDLNESVLNDSSCSGGVSSLEDFGSEFVASYESSDDTEEDDSDSEDENAPPTISSFEVSSQTSGVFTAVSWQADATSCEGNSTPEIDAWSDEPVGTSGIRNIRSSMIPDEGTRLNLTCERNGEDVSAAQFIEPTDNTGTGPESF